MGPARRPGESLASALDRTLACEYGLDIIQIPATSAAMAIFTTAKRSGPSSSSPPASTRCRSTGTHRSPTADRLRQSSGPDQPGSRPPGRPRHAGTVGRTEDPPRQRQITTTFGACSEGTYCEEAATKLIISRRSRLLRDDFTSQFILTSAGSVGSITAVIDWEEALTALRADNLLCSSSEAAIVHLAASLATASAVILRHAIVGLDQTNLHLVMNAVRRVGGQN
jgi:hypothetical protein